MNPRSFVLSIFCWIAAAPAFGETRLLGPAGSLAREPLATRLPSTLLRDNIVSLDTRRVVNGGRGAPELTLQLFPDVELRATLNRVETHGAKTFHWHGRAVDDFASMVVLTVADGRLFGSVVYHGRRYAIGWLPSGNYHVSEVDLAALPPDDPSHPREGAAIPYKGSRPHPGLGLLIRPTIDVMVVWSGEVEHLQACYIYSRVVLHGLLDCIPYMLAHPVDWKAIMTDVLVPHAIAETNFVFANSGLGTPFKLVHAQSVAYAGSGDLILDRDNLKGMNDGFIDLIHGVRNGHKADLVMLVTYHGDEDWCGMADVPPTIDVANSGLAFGVVSAQCFLNGNFVFTHELAHLMGAHHDWHVYEDGIGGGNPPPRKYAHGYTRMPEGLRTIMAYPDECIDEGGILCARVPFFSDGAAWGRPETDPEPANNAKMLSEAHWTIGMYR